jgi:uncharacterized membrane protein
MKNRKLFIAACMLLLVISVLPACSAIEGIFKAGVWTGILLVGVILLLVIYLLSRAKK